MDRINLQGKRLKKHLCVNLACLCLKRAQRSDFCHIPYVPEGGLETGMAPRSHSVVLLEPFDGVTGVLAADSYEEMRSRSIFLYKLLHPGKCISIMVTDLQAPEFCSFQFIKPSDVA